MKVQNYQVNVGIPIGGKDSHRNDQTNIWLEFGIILHLQLQAPFLILLDFLHTLY